jgi:hypothetical protein
MRRRKRRKINHPGQNFDSFLDTMTNTIGVLMFITLFTTLIAEKSTSVVRTPLASKIEKTPRFFEIRDNKITYINDTKVGAEIEEIISNLPACNQPEVTSGLGLSETQAYLDYRSCIQSRANRLINFQTQTDFYNVKMVNASTFSLLYEPLPTKEGESKPQLQQPNSNFQKTLAKLNPNQDYLAFIVRPDSFATFRAAREQAWKQGFNVGWEPHKEDAPIIFGSGGRTIDAQ